MLFPNKVKHRKWQTGRKNPKKLAKKVETRGAKVSFGSFGLKAESHGRITSNQIEAARKAIKRYVGKTGKVWIRIYPDRPITKKPDQVKLGKGKGEPKYFVSEVFTGRVLFEVEAASDEIAKEALRKGGTKLPVKTKVIAKLI